MNPKRYLYAAVHNRAFNYLTHARVMRRSHAMMQSAGRAPGMSQVFREHGRSERGADPPIRAAPGGTGTRGGA